MSYSLNRVDSTNCTNSNIKSKPNRNVIMRCEDSIDGIFTAIYDAFVYKNKLQQAYAGEYNDSISIEIGEGENYTLFTEVIDIQTDRDKAQKTITSIKNRLGYGIYETVFNVLCHFSQDRATIVLGFLVRAFKIGQRIMEHMSDKYVMGVFELARKTNNEADKLRGFIRFSDNGSFLMARFSPKCNMIPIIMWHFADRYPGENFVIYDEIRKYAVVHPMNGNCFFISDTDFKALEAEVPEEIDDFEQMWKIYFESTDIRERFNPTCQRNLCPKWYRKNMPEFG